MNTRVYGLHAYAPDFYLLLLILRHAYIHIHNIHIFIKILHYLLVLNENIYQSKLKTNKKKKKRLQSENISIYYFMYTPFVSLLLYLMLLLFCVTNRWKYYRIIDVAKLKKKNKYTHSGVWTYIRISEIYEIVLENTFQSWRIVYFML